MKTLLRTITLLFVVTFVANAEDLNPAVVKWLDQQTKVQSWTADFTQTRRLKSLTQPLKSPGKVWFSAPNHFRWELGHPPKTIAVRAPQGLLLMYPHLKRVERFPLNDQQTGPWREALSLLEAGFPRSREQLNAQYNIVSQNITGEMGRLVLQPKSAVARKMMPQIEVDFDTKEFLLRGTELQFADGSSMRNDFANIVINPQVDPQLFTPAIPPNYKIIEPLKHQ